MVSIIVPVYNRVSSIQRCVQSIINQNFQDIEVLLIDDGSTDDSGAICDELAMQDVRIRVFHKENGGVSSARNLGLEAAKGEYILFCDSDDWVEPQWCEKLLAEVTEESLPICNYYRCNEESQSKNKPKKCANIPCNIDVEQFYEMNAAELLGIPWNKLFDREKIEEHHIRFRDGLSLGEDLLFVLQYLKTGIRTISFINEPLYHYSVSGTDSLSQKYYPNLEEIYKIQFQCIEETLRFLGSFERNESAFWHSYFYAIERTFDNNLSSQNTEKWVQKHKKNCILFHSEQFQTAARFMSKRDMNIVSFLGLRTGSYTIYRWSMIFAQRISRILHRR